MGPVYLPTLVFGLKLHAGVTAAPVSDKILGQISLMPAVAGNVTLRPAVDGTVTVVSR